MERSESDIAIGIDIGGTAIKGGLIDAHGKVLERRSVATCADDGVDQVLSRVAALITELSAQAGQYSAARLCVGVGVPGTIRHREGIVEAPPNLPGWRDVPVVDRLARATGLHVVLENDARAAALGEYLCGAGRGTRDMVMLTLGTGVGGGIIADGKLLRGHYENAGELGHMIVVPGGRECGCGQKGCLEAYSSASNTAARMMEFLKAGEASSLSVCLQRGEEITAEHVAQAAEEGDALAARVWRETCFLLAIACINLQHMLNPQRIVLAGGMSAAGTQLLRPIRQLIDQHCSRMLGPLPTVELAQLGNDAGLVGAALSALAAV